jgi:small subunit ribosomal protein S17
VSEEQTPVQETPVQETPEEQAPVTQTPVTETPVAQTPAMETRSRRKVRVGVVVSEGMDKTVMVRIDRKMRHARYGKIVARSMKLAAHDENNEAHVGDTVRVMEIRPLSKTKHWRLVEIVERAK